MTIQKKQMGYPALMLALAMAATASVTANAKMGEKNLTPEEKREIALNDAIDQWPDSKLHEFARKDPFIPLATVAKYHPMPAISFSGVSLSDKAQAAQAALFELAETVEDIRADIPEEDLPLQYIVDAADTALFELSQTINSTLSPASRKLDKAEEFVTSGQATLQIVAATNFEGAGSNQQKCKPLREKGVGTALPEEQKDCADTELPKTNARLVNGIDGGQFGPIAAQVGQGIIVLVNEEMPLVLMAKQYIEMAGKATKSARDMVSGISAGMARAEDKKEEMASYAAQYSESMKGTAEAANASAEAVQKVIDAVVDFGTSLYKVAAKGDQVINGQLQPAYDKVYACTQQNLETGALLQTDASDDDKEASVRASQYKNLEAVTAVANAAGPVEEWKSEKGGSIAIAPVALGQAGDTPVEAGSSDSVDEGVLREGKSGAQQLLCEAGKTC